MSDAAVAISRLREEGATIATAESLTGGQLAARITAVAGASAVYAGGVVSYATEVKISLLGVPEDLVAAHGVVSAQCARAMAEGVRGLLRTSYGVSTTGVAGPDTQDGQPVGTVFVAVAGPVGTEVVRLALTGDRAAIQAAAVDGALSALTGMIRG
ncbi:CinA family protein [Nocardioides silvaticus]|uniref:CinA family protein n=1 Tax=Nocardioides silvaticus TaxID=2201891 RepID=A0A316TEJ1_9ACTN|nr:nicotinamide-nucleotide amidohydrolase family protein [Nocardioides silvaticus]PWN02903.1 CinA family protein [Nocardioides silvaticus]